MAKPVVTVEIRVVDGTSEQVAARLKDRLNKIEENTRKLGNTLDKTTKASIDRFNQIQQSLKGIDLSSNYESLTRAGQEQVREAVRVARETERVAAQEFKDIQKIHAAKVRMAEQSARAQTNALAQQAREAQRITESEMREIQRIHAQKVRLAEQSARAQTNAEMQAAREVARINSETRRQADQQERLRERSSKNLADFQIDQSKRAANEFIRTHNTQQRASENSARDSSASWTKYLNQTLQDWDTHAAFSFRVVASSATAWSTSGV